MSLSRPARIHGPVRTPVYGPPLPVEKYCDLCYQELGRAYLLECQHAVCKTCVQALLGPHAKSLDSVECPLCLHLSHKVTELEVEPTTQNLGSLRKPTSSIDHPVLACQSALHVSTRGHGRQSPAAEILCIDTGEFLCKACSRGPAYKDRNNVPIEVAAEGYVLRLSREIRAVNAGISELKPLRASFRETHAKVSESLQEAHVRLLQLRGTICDALDRRIQQLEQDLEKLQDGYEGNLLAEEEALLDMICAASDVAADVGKRVAHQGALALLSEYGDLEEAIQRARQGLQETSAHMHSPQPLVIPAIVGEDEVLMAIRNLNYKTGHCLVGKVQSRCSSALKERVLCCRACSNVILDLDALSTLRAVAKHRKGALCGVPIDFLHKDGVLMDLDAGSPQSRRVLCWNCKREVGRWSETDGELQASLVYISTNAVSAGSLERKRN
ncbi:hypothetical protein GMRT_14683 [Giardia muris]|uniref:RING-type domain-containing protein n=1 Tax=Giardia muris TaxID=5742 RepID=A0A4Z1SL94_GIAMU|nr:hypothetical protein GMRT_14683 [Giardia muris]|eukprot:TNJ26402.1 hypothetical protein GMRT_14683 [Giardia muris]